MKKILVSIIDPFWWTQWANDLLSFYWYPKIIWIHYPEATIKGKENAFIHLEAIEIELINAESIAELPKKWNMGDLFPISSTSWWNKKSSIVIDQGLGHD